MLLDGETGQFRTPRGRPRADSRVSSADYPGQYSFAATP